MFLRSNEFDLKKRIEQIEKNPAQPKPKRQAGLWDNAFGATVSGVFEAPSDILSTVTPWEYDPDPLKKNALTVNPEETGAIGQLGHGLMHTVSAIMVGGSIGGAVGGPLGFMVGGAIGVFLADSRRAYENARDVGQDKETATQVGVKTGAISAGGALIPAGFGANAVRSAVLSAGVNVGLSQVDRMGDYAILKANGYDELAEHATEIDAVSLTADIVLGLAFGALHAKQNKRAKAVKDYQTKTDSEAGSKVSDSPTADGIIYPTLHEVDLATGALQEIITDRTVKSGFVTVTEEAHTTAHRVSDRVKTAMEQGENAETSFSITAEEQSILDRGSIKRGEPELSSQGVDSPHTQKVSNTIDVMENGIRHLESRGKAENIPPGLKRDMRLVKQKIFDSAFACFFEHGGK
ncbi:hypothetical protein AYJ09_01415 [Candidatus Liberibacter solanacearum]|uniref:hypothetical protein n=1 Tax=Candidatus Liberibacter solanacearum TaxID=556287 RepID=UPI0009790242|nr:hypothetical protein [Candidatus Liberibacter solanacearum]ONI59071.1 hypothetical protein AYJ09_01415 [Candidatus Liberibacter solanacearum]